MVAEFPKKVCSQITGVSNALDLMCVLLQCDPGAAKSDGQSSAGCARSVGRQLPGSPFASPALPPL